MSRPKRITHRLCMAGYAEILRGVVDVPATAQELAARHDVTEHVMRGITRRLHAQRMLRVAEWRRATQGPAMRVFGIGGEPDAPRPPTVTGKPSRHINVTAPTPQPRIEITSFANLMRALDEMRTAQELAEITGIGRASLSRNLKHMRRIGLIHIAGWDRPRYGPPLPAYQFGIDMRDANKPLPAAKSKANARYNDARRARRQQMRIVIAQCARPIAFAPLELEAA